MKLTMIKQTNARVKEKYLISRFEMLDFVPFVVSSLVSFLV
jgi:hypothetical protein